jgi:hydroxyacylglutathione hydrolase
MQVIAIDTLELGNRSYIVHDGRVGVVIDPSRRLKPLVDAAKKEQISIYGVFETHVHNDYVTGGYSLSQSLGVPYFVSTAEPLAFEAQQIVPESELVIGKLRLTSLRTPGHTHSHVGYLIEQEGETPAFFSGGSLLYGTVGRTDLVGSGDTLRLAQKQYQSAQFLRDRLDESTMLYPTHGFGSFCSATETEVVSVSTLKQQLKTNLVYTAGDESTFVEALILGLDDYPTYYSYMAKLNLEGPPGPAAGAPVRLTRESVLTALHAGIAIVDVRARADFAAGHLRGTLNIELSKELVSYLGWLLAYDAPFILVTENSEQALIARDQLALIGREIFNGWTPSRTLLASKTGSEAYPVRTFSDLTDVRSDQGLIILDVRRKTERQKGYVDGSTHIPVHELMQRVDEINPAKTVWVHCSNGFRAGIAASILDSYGRHVVLVDDTFTSAAKAGILHVERRQFIDEIEAGTALLIDVRDRSEWVAGRATGAIHIPVGLLLGGGLDELADNKRIYLYCDTGDRSGMAENYLLGSGYDAVNIGGLSDWIQAGGSYTK